MRENLVNYYTEELNKALPCQNRFERVVLQIKANQSIRNVELKGIVSNFDGVNPRRSREDNITELEAIYSFSCLQRMRKRTEYTADNPSKPRRVFRFLKYVITF